MSNRLPLASEPRRSLRQRIEIAFSRFLDAIEENDFDTIATHGQTLDALGVNVRIEVRTHDRLQVERERDASV